MKLIIGFAIVIGSIVAGYVLSHGNLMAIVQPYELLIIGGSALGAFVVSNPGPVIKKTFASLPTLLKGPKYGKAEYMDLLGLLYDIFSKSRKEGMMSLEKDIDDVHQSALFQAYPKILADHHVVDFIVDYLRLMVSGSTNAMEIEALMDVELETHHHEAELPASALTQVSDGLPGFGIVAAVLGVVITMGSLGGPVTEIGAHVAAALVGTFLGILLAYGFVGPMGVYLKHQADAESKFFTCIKVTMLATLNGYSPQVAVEFGRKTLQSTDRPGFLELEEHVKKRKA
jgi:chemotaxis protein MotA